ncbi:hypothetical protein ACFC1T_09290 [Kitasatospora sp. NPDC056076]|uniref:hypothetical protein n=1 Tax=Kitasatospora sp. NPDC056076 TaxID=3345703 RepID=UPI0035E008BE
MPTITVVARHADAVPEDAVVTYRPLVYAEILHIEDCAHLAAAGTADLVAKLDTDTADMLLGDPHKDRTVGAEKFGHHTCMAAVAWGPAALATFSQAPLTDS